MEIIKKIRFEIGLWWKYSIMHPIKTFKIGINNLIKWRSVIWQDRWYDYGFIISILKFKLKDMESNWGVNTFHENDYVQKELLQSLIRDLEQAEKFDEVLNEKEAKKAYQNFFNRFGRNIIKLYD